ncbi:glycosyl hydrolase [Sphingomonas sp. R-74633]|uniref:glycoside hydrolase family 76 protein n=1 Tax=Sphingomonas sp. R-74633 TaxID=2751188 RepID=UPI0015D40DF2|nr:glycoside hydrolase family 76 protein [Sphingomonas sp. R-74633]NYT41472.1 glycosyl hydrolase [Sphingomonas sp. R-74633]
MLRAEFWAATSLCAAVLAPAVAAPDVAHAQAFDAAASAQHAEELLAATRKYLGTGDDTGLYQEQYPAHSPDGKHADEWPFSQVHIGVLDLSNVPGTGERYRDTLAAHRKAQMLYWVSRSATGLPGFASRVGPPHGRGGDLYYDDNDWVGLAAIQHWLLYKDTESLDLAKAIFALVSAAWDDNPKHPAPGGLFWSQQPGNSDRNTVSNMPAAQLGVRLYQATGDKAYLDEALRFYTWTNSALQRPDGLYLDHLDLAGKIDTRIFSYNQGVPIGVNVLLHEATGDAKYLAEAKRIAEASFDHFVTGRQLDRHSVQFNAIWFKNLLLLESVTGGTRYRDAIRDYAARMWREHRDPKTGLLVRQDGRHRGEIHLIDQGAMLQILAVLAWDPKDYGKLY